MSEQTPVEEPSTDTLPDGLEIPVGGSLPDEGSQAGSGPGTTPAGEIPTKPTTPERKPLPPVAAAAVAAAFQQRFNRPDRPVPDQVPTRHGHVPFYQVEADGNVVKAWIGPVEEEGKEPDYVVVNGPAYVLDPDGDLTAEDGHTYRYDPVAAIAEAIAADRGDRP